MPQNQGRFRSPARARIVPLATVVLALASTAGCGASREVRVVYRDGEGGVIGLPQNTNRWPHYYRSQADRLMAKHFPNDGYLVVREVEVNSGDKLVFDGHSESAESGLSGKIRNRKLKGAISHGEQSSQKITEAQVFYVKNDPSSRLKSGMFARSNTYTPAGYDGPVSDRLLARIEDDGPDADRQAVLASYHGDPPRPRAPVVKTEARRAASAPAKPRELPSLPMPKLIAVPEIKLDE